MIVTVTFNPSLDLTYHLDETALGAVDVHRCARSSLEASGKGVNVSRDLHAAGVATTAILPTAGATGRLLGELLRDAGLDHVAVPVPGETRINSTILLAHGQTIKVNGPGPRLTHEHAEDLLAAAGERLSAAAAAPRQRWLVVAGSLAPGVDPAVVAEFVRLAHRHTARCAVDISGPALAVAVEAGADLVAPNEFELGELLGVDPPHTLAEAAGLAQAVARERAVELLVSMGRAGAVHADATTVTAGSGPELLPVNTAGAGDAFLAGWLAEDGPPEQRMAHALAWGRSACLCPSTVDPEPGSRGRDGIVVRTLTPADPARPGSPPP